MRGDIELSPYIAKVVDSVLEEFSHEDDFRRYIYQLYPEMKVLMRQRARSKSVAVRQLRFLDFVLREATSSWGKWHIDSNHKMFNGESAKDWDWLTCDVEIDTIPIYNDGLIVAHREIFISPAEIPNLVRFITVRGTSAGLDLENHNFGYHFHYGYISRNSLKRTDLLLTFDPKPVAANNNVIPLYGETHASGKNISISPGAIGLNKKIPIYAVCVQHMQKIGQANFKIPGAQAFIFHP